MKLIRTQNLTILQIEKHRKPHYTPKTSDVSDGKFLKPKKKHSGMSCKQIDCSHGSCSGAVNKDYYSKWTNIMAKKEQDNLTAEFDKADLATEMDAPYKL